MKSPAALVFSGLLLVLPAVAQHGGHSGGGHSFGGSGFHGGAYSGRGSYGGGYYRGGAAIVPYVPYAPAFGYGYYAPPADGYGYGYADPGDSYAPAPPPPPQPPPPPAEMYYAPDGQPEPPPPPPSDVQQGQAPTPQEQAMADGRYYLIAYKDHSVYTALAYWMENGVLNYVTPQNAHNQISLDLLDLDFTKQLNARRGQSFNIATADMRR